MRDDESCPARRSNLQFPSHRRHLQAILCETPSRVFFLAPGTRQMSERSVNSKSSTLCTCVCTVASFTAHETMTDLDVRVRKHIESLDCVLARKRLGYLATLARSSCCQVLLGVLSLCLRNSPYVAIQLVSLCLYEHWNNFTMDSACNLRSLPAV